MATSSEYTQDGGAEYDVEILESYVLESRVHNIVDNPDIDSVDGN